MAAYTRPKRISLKNHPVYSENWVQDSPNLRAALADMGEATPEQVARQFKRGRAGTVQPLLESLTALGQARETDGGRFAA